MRDKKIGDHAVNQALLAHWRREDDSTPPDEITMSYGHSVAQIRRAVVRLNFILCDVERALLRNDFALLHRALERLDKAKIGRHPLLLSDLLDDLSDLSAAVEKR